MSSASLVEDPQGRVLPVGWIDGNIGQIGYQLVGIAMAWAFALVGTIVLLKITDLVVGVRASEEQEIERPRPHRARKGSV